MGNGCTTWMRLKPSKFGSFRYLIKRNQIIPAAIPATTSRGTPQVTKVVAVCISLMGSSASLTGR